MIIDISKNICLPCSITNPPRTANGIVFIIIWIKLACKKGLNGIPLSPFNVRGSMPQSEKRWPVEKLINSTTQINATNPRIQYKFFFRGIFI
jgi:hypothetical protein